MDKPSDYESDIRGSNPLEGTNLPTYNCFIFTCYKKSPNQQIPFQSFKINFFFMM